MKYKIREKQIFNKTELIETNYFIVRKFLWWWIKVSIRNAYTLGGSGILLERSYYEFDRKEIAEKNLKQWVLNPYKEKYKGNNIIQVKCNHCYGGVIYINKSNIVDFYAQELPTYEADLNLKELKERIDKRNLISKIKKK